jgi:hypothetical protein
MHQIVLENCYKFKGEGFLNSANEVFEIALDGLSGLTPYRLAVLNLLANIAHVERDQIATINFSVLGRQEMIEVLDKVLKEYREDLKKKGEDDGRVAEADSETAIEGTPPAPTQQEDRRWYKRVFIRFVKLVTGIDLDDPELRHSA